MNEQMRELTMDEINSVSGGEVKCGSFALYLLTGKICCTNSDNPNIDCYQY